MKRRSFIKSSLLSGFPLPFLESVQSENLVKPPPLMGPNKRLVCLGAALGFHQESFFPKQSGKDYEIPNLLKPLSDMKDQFSVFEGLDHRLGHGHKDYHHYLTGKRGGISLDQLVARETGKFTRKSSLGLAMGLGTNNSFISFSSSGNRIFPKYSPSQVYNEIFPPSSYVKKEKGVLESGKSIIDVILNDAKLLKKSLSKIDKDSLENYFESIRGVEKELDKRLYWANNKIEKVQFKPSANRGKMIMGNDYLSNEKLMYELMLLALQVDYTRVISFSICPFQEVYTVNNKRLTKGYHDLSHYNNQPELIKDYNKIGLGHIKNLRFFLDRLKSIKDSNGESLFATTAVLLGSGLGNSATHTTRNLPILLAGGKFKHGKSHKISNKNSSSPVLLGDLYISIMNSMGIEKSKFAEANRNLNELIL